MSGVGSFCTHCGAKIEPTSSFCPSCGRPTQLESAQAGATIPSLARKSISRDRAILAYIIGIIIPGVGHMIVGRIARGILIFAGGWLVGFLSGLWGGLIFVIIFGIAYWVFQLIDLYKQIHKMEVVKT